jgi:four helix bundle protein
MKIEKFEDIIAWQKAKSVTVEIYKVFSGTKDYGFKDQIQRASLSIMNNIAEGYERKGNKEFKNFLYIAKGSSAEVRSMILLAGELNYLSGEKTDTLLFSIEEVSRLISGLIKTL